MVTLPPGAVRSVLLVDEVMTLKLLQVYGAKALVVTNTVEGAWVYEEVVPRSLVTCWIRLGCGLYLQGLEPKE